MATEAFEPTAIVFETPRCFAISDNEGMLRVKLAPEYFCHRSPFTLFSTEAARIVNGPVPGLPETNGDGSLRALPPPDFESINAGMTAHPSELKASSVKLKSDKRRAKMGIALRGSPYGGTH